MAAQPSAFPATDSLGASGWPYQPGYCHYAAPHLLICDNLLDFSHLGYVHPTTLGGTENVAQSRPKVTAGEALVRVERWLLNEVPAPFHIKVASFAGRVDRWHFYDFHVPGVLVMHSGVQAPGTGAPEGRVRDALEFRSCQAVTPESTTSSHYFFAVPRNFAVDDAQVTARIFAFIGFADATGEGYWTRLSSQAETHGLKIVANERYARTDNNITAQALRIVGANPDAVLIAASGSPAALPQIGLKERGYKGVIYQTHGVANNDFLRVVGKSAEGTYLPVGPLLVADQLPANDAVGKLGNDVIRRYEAQHGEGSRTTFISNAYDPYLLLDSAVRTAVAKARPCIPAFRAALRDALEATREFAGTRGCYNMSASDHVGLDRRSRYIVRIEDGKWKMAR